MNRLSWRNKLAIYTSFAQNGIVFVFSRICFTCRFLEHLSYVCAFEVKNAGGGEWAFWCKYACPPGAEFCRPGLCFTYALHVYRFLEHLYVYVCEFEVKIAGDKIGILV